MDQSEQEHDVASIRIHEQYMTRGYSFDIALLKLASPAQLVPGKVSVACLPVQGKRAEAGTECFITGESWSCFAITLLVPCIAIQRSYIASIM